MSTPQSFLKVLGPGLLFAGAAVGVSHLVQSTRAGAVYGLGLVLVVILANLFKYPAFSFGPRYAAATGTSLLEGYRQLGRWALALYALLTVATMFTVQAAVTLVTASLATVTFLPADTSLVLITAVTLGICMAICGLGQFKLLDRVIKVVVVFLTLSTVAATLVVMPSVPWTGPWLPSFTSPSGEFDLATFGFIAALVGWMPSAIDISVWHSLWTLAKRDTTGHRPSVRQSMLDFNIGYGGTVFLAFCFLLLGAGVMHGSGEPVAAGAVGFSRQILSLYTETLGGWAGPLIALSALAVMFSTTVTCMDGFSRAIAVVGQRFKGPESPGDDAGPLFPQRAYVTVMVVLAVGATSLIAFATKPPSPGEPPALFALVDLATILSFLTAPLLAALNHRVMHAASVPSESLPPRWLRRLSIAGIAFLSLFALAYVALRIAQ